jgi:REP element-mobilizing transposase RayT
MTNYRRNFVPGGSYFFTVNLADRRLRLLTDHIDLLRGAVRYAQSRHPFSIEAVVVLPDHLHAIWTLPEGDSDFPPLAPHKGNFFASPACQRAHLAEPPRKNGARYLATALLGAHIAQ